MLPAGILERSYDMLSYNGDYQTEVMEWCFTILTEDVPSTGLVASHDSPHGSLFPVI